MDDGGDDGGEGCDGGGGSGGVTFVAFDADGVVTFVAFDADGVVMFVVFDADGVVTFVAFDADGGDGALGGGGGHGETRYQQLGGPSADEFPQSCRAYDAVHADASQNMSVEPVTELVSHPEMSALNADAP